MSATQARADPGKTRTSATHTLVILTAISFFNGLDRMVIAVLLEPIKADLKLSDTQMGLIAGLAFAVLYATAGLPLARIADRRSRVTLLSICLAVWSVMTAVTGLARGFAELFIARMGVGVGEAGCAPAAHSMIGDLYSPERRAFAVSIFQAGSVLGASFGLALVGLAAELWGWRIALVVIGALGIPLALLTYLTVDEPLREGGNAAPSTETIGPALKALFRSRPLRQLIVGISIGTFGGIGVVQWIPAFYIRIHDLGVAEAGLYTGLVAAVSGVFGTLFGGAALAKLAPRDSRWELWWPLIVFSLSVPFWIVALYIDSWRVALTLQFIALFIVSSGGGVALSAMQTYAEPQRRATAIAILLMLSSILGLGIGPVLIGAVSDLLAPQLGEDSLRYALMGSTLLLVWSSAHFWLAARYADDKPQAN